MIRFKDGWRLVSRKAARPQLKVEPYDPDAKDGDGDGIVQEGTAWERPVGTRFLRMNGRPIPTGLETAYRPSTAKLVDRDGNEVEYTPTYERPGYKPLGTTIGETVGNVAEGAKKPKRTLIPKRFKKRKLSKSLDSVNPGGTEMTPKEFRKMVKDYHGRRFKDIGDPWNFEVTGFQVDEDGRRRRLKRKINRNVLNSTADGVTMNPDYAESVNSKILTSILISRRMRENGHDPADLLPEDIRENTKLFVSERGRLHLVRTDRSPSLAVRDFEGETVFGSIEVDPTDPLYDELYDQVAVSWAVHQWAVGSDMTKGYAGVIQAAAHEYFGLAGDAPNYGRGRVRLENDEGTIDEIITDERLQTFVAFIDAQYEETQQMLSEQGIQRMRLYRGFELELGETIPEEVLDPDMLQHQILRKWIEENEPQSLFMRGVPSPLRPLSSYSTEEEMAVSFSREQRVWSAADANIVTKTDVPVERILAIPGTGIGCLGESEMVVIGPPEGADDVQDLEAKVFARSNFWTEGMIKAARQLRRDEADEDPFDKEEFLKTLPENVQNMLKSMNEDEKDEVLFDLWYEMQNR
jgi:hypothetical protein